MSWIRKLSKRLLQSSSSTAPTSRHSLEQYADLDLYDPAMESQERFIVEDGNLVAATATLDHEWKIHPTSLGTLPKG